MSSHVCKMFQQLPFEDFLLFLFNSSTAPSSLCSGALEEGSCEQQQLVQEFVQLQLSDSLNNKIMSNTTGNSRKERTKNNNANIGSDNSIVGHPSPIYSTPVSTTKKTTANSSSQTHLPFVILTAASSRKNSDRNSEILTLPLIHQHQSQQWVTTNVEKPMSIVVSSQNSSTYKNNGSKLNSSLSSKSSTIQSRRSCNALDELAFYKNFSACPGKSRSKSSSNSVGTAVGGRRVEKTRLCRSVPINCLNFSQMTNNNNSINDEAEQDPMDTDEDNNAFNEHAFQNSHQFSGARDHDRSNVNKSQTSTDTKYKKNLSLSSTSTNPKMVATSFNKKSTIDLTLNERVEKTMSLYLDAVQLGQRQEFENTSTYVKLYY